VKVLVGDPGEQLVQTLGEILQDAGFCVLTAQDGPQALAVWEAERPDLVLLEDRQLPRLAGSVVARAIRQRGGRTPVILLSEHPTEDAIIHGLESGADDYLAKRISLRQLLARIEALRRRATAVQDPAPLSEVRVGGWRLDLVTGNVTTPVGQSVWLTHPEYRLLHLLLSNVGQAVSHAQLAKACWGSSDQQTMQLLKPHLTRVRRKLGLGVRGPQAIEAVPGMGYRLVLLDCTSPRSIVN
jgi:DNA-binding response OmpR family regulator